MRDHAHLHALRNARKQLPHAQAHQGRVPVGQLPRDRQAGKGVQRHVLSVPVHVHEHRPQSRVPAADYALGIRERLLCVRNSEAVHQHHERPPAGTVAAQRPQDGGGCLGEELVLRRPPCRVRERTPHAGVGGQLPPRPGVVLKVRAQAPVAHQNAPVVHPYRVGRVQVAVPIIEQVDPGIGVPVAPDLVAKQHGKLRRGGRGRRGNEPQRQHRATPLSPHGSPALHCNEAPAKT